MRKFWFRENSITLKINQRLWTRVRKFPAEVSSEKKQAIRATKRKSGHQKIWNFSACKAQVNQYEIRIAFLERDNVIKDFVRLFMD